MKWLVVKLYKILYKKEINRAILIANKTKSQAIILTLSTLDLLDK